MYVDHIFDYYTHRIFMYCIIVIFKIYHLGNDTYVHI